MPRSNPSSSTFDYLSVTPAVRAGLLPLVIVLILAVCASVLVTDINRIRHQNTGDFEHFYYAAQAVHQGADPYAAHTRGYIYPPLIAFLFQPLALMSYDHAAAVMLIINVAVTLLAVALAVEEFQRRFDAPRDLLMTAILMLPALLLNIDKIKGEWQMWQTDVWMLLLFVMALRWIDRLPFFAGLALGMAINIKYIPLIFLPYFLVRRRWTAAVGLIVGIIVFAVLPALSTGWAANIRNWGTATNGLLQMAEVQSGHTEAAEVHDVKDSLSCSITSAMARTAGKNAGLGFLLAGSIALLFMGIAGVMYHRHGVGLFTSAYLSPTEPGRVAPVVPKAQNSGPTRPGSVHDNPQLTAVEWVMLIAIVLAFAPQTNTRHLFDALIFTSAASVLLVFAKPGTNRWTLLIGTAILFLGFVLPPGSRTFHGERTPTVLWLRMGGPCWCLVIGAFTLLWTGLVAMERLHHERTA